MQKGDRTRIVRCLACLMLLALAAAMASPALASESSPAAAGDVNPMGPSAWKLDLALWTGVVFLCLAAILGKFAWKPITEGLDKRERHVAEQIAQAEAANQQAKESLADYERRLATAGDQVRGILEQGRRHAEQIGQEMIEKARQESQAEHERALRQIEAAADAAVKDLADQSAQMAVRLAGRILRAEIKPRDHATLIDQAVAGFAHEKSTTN
jgi:F-type H+-transporting ATPase subunit b